MHRHNGRDREYKKRSVRYGSPIIRESILKTVRVSESVCDDLLTKIKILAQPGLFEKSRTSLQEFTSIQVDNLQ